VHRPFYPNGGYKGRRKEDLFRGHGVSSLEPLLRRCERAGKGRRQARCLFWTLGGNQVGKAAICGWRDVFAPALRGGGPVSLWPFDGALPSLLVPGNVVVAESTPQSATAGSTGRWQQERPERKEKVRAQHSFAGLTPRALRIASLRTFKADSRRGTMPSPRCRPPLTKLVALGSLLP